MKYRFGPYRIDSDSRILLDGDEVVRIPPKAVDLLLCLVEHQGSVVPKEELFAKVWPDTAVQESSLAQAVLTLRRSLKPGFGDSEFIESVPRRGYRLTVAAIPENDDVVPAPISEAPALTGEAPVLTAVLAAPVVQSPASTSLFKRHLPRRYILVGLPALALVVLGLTTGRLQTFYQQPFDVQPLTTAQEKEDDSNISADGKHVAYAWRRAGEAHYNLWIKTIGATAPARVVRSDGDDRKPVWAPDRPMLAFVRTKDGTSEIHVIATDAEVGGDKVIAPATSPDCDLTWSHDGKWLAFGDHTKATGIRTVNLETSQQRQLTFPPPTFFDSEPKFSPDGKTLGFVRHSSIERFSNVYSVAVEGGSIKQLTRVKRTVRGFDWTQDSQEIVYSSDILGNFRLFRTRVDGTQEPRWLESAGFNAYSPSISIRGDRMTFTRAYQEQHLYSVPSPGLVDHGPIPGLNQTPLDQTALDGKALAEKAIGKKMDLPGWRRTSPAFSPDGSRLAFVSDAGGSIEIWTSNADGSHPVALTKFTEGGAGSPAWSPDGRFIAYDRKHPTQGVTQIFIVPSSGGEPKQFTMDIASHTVPTWSVDGKWIYYSSSRSGAREIWRQAVGSDAVEQITHTTGMRARPSRDGKYIYYFHVPDGRLWRALATGGSEELVTEVSPLANPANWNITARGIYWEGRDSALQTVVFFFDFSSRKTTVVAAGDPLPLIPDAGGIGVSPDDKTMILSRLGAAVQRIMVVDGFR